MAYNTDHLVALMTRLSNETARHGKNHAMQVYLQGIRREIKQEEEFLERRGVNIYRVEEISDDDLMAALFD